MDEDLCLLPADEQGWILDRLAALQQVIDQQDLEQALRDNPPARPERACVLTRQIMLWVVLAMGLLTHLPIRQVFKACRRLHHGEGAPRRSSLCVARRRLGIAPVRQLFQCTVQLLATPDTPGAFYKGLRLMDLDGTTLLVPDSPANAHAFGYPTGGRGDGAFPQVRKLSLVEAGTHAEVAFARKGLREEESSEKAMAPALLRHLRPGQLLLWDRGFFSYRLWECATATGAHVLARVSVHLVLRPVRTLSDGSYLAYLYPNEGCRQRNERGLLVRVIRYTHNDPRRVGCGEEHVLLTSLLDAERYPALELIVLYHERWEIELVFDEQKTHQTPRRATKTAHLRSETPQGVIQEVYALSLGHYVVRALMAQAAATRQLDPDRLSFLGCLQILQTRLPECPTGPPATLRSWLDGLLWEMSQEVIEPRQNRVNPRVVKVKTSKFPRKRPHHRGLPPLQHPFVDTVVMTV
jgi:Transposase DDE domain/Insertion element 4 transposase N-terminal